MHLPGNIGGFRLDALLSKGASTAVHRASDVDGRLVCLKFAWTDEANERLLTQAAFLRGLAGDVFPEVFAVGLEGEYGWCAMEFIDGPTLGAYLRTTPDAERALGWMVARVCREFADLERVEGEFHHGSLTPDHLLVDGVRLRAVSPGGETQDSLALASILLDAAPSHASSELVRTLRAWTKEPPDFEAMDRTLRRLWGRSES